jgi:anaerobic magnesium-protoporphyrin IX monomethyl ester cyclase
MLAHKAELDILLLFPPQWSPFQPALSMPSLSSWVKRAGFLCKSIDLNIDFYRHILSGKFERVAATLLEGKKEVWGSDKLTAYGQILNSRERILERLRSIRTPKSDAQLLIDEIYVFNKTLETYCAALSDLQDDFVLSPYSFELKAGLTDKNIELLTANMPAVLSLFFGEVLTNLRRLPSRFVGISCIGQDQLFFSLLIGRLIKKNFSMPVLVGGTIFPRIFERGTLPASWFGSYFDYVVCNEGEKPLEFFMRHADSQDTIRGECPGIIFADPQSGKIRRNLSGSPLKPMEMPIPDFDDLPIADYLSPEITLPLLSSRGCYWGKCEFCHHGMVYGDGYSPYGITHIQHALDYLAARYNVRHFAFNDEAIPPKIFRAMAKRFRPHDQSGYLMTGLIKFEKYFSREDFRQAYDVGFRTLYVGLESASERVLDLMRKPNRKETIYRNLCDARDAGIWMHCFLFFGFPGETDQDAEETYNFVLTNSQVIRSFGAGMFVLEHNAPIYFNAARFGVRIDRSRTSSNVADVFYKHEVSVGNETHRSRYWLNKLNRDSQGIDTYRGIGWIPREHLLPLISDRGVDAVQMASIETVRGHGLSPTVRVSDVLTIGDEDEGEGFVATCLLNGRSARVKGAASEVVRLLLTSEASVSDVYDSAEPVLSRFAFVSDASLPSVKAHPMDILPR